MNIRELFEQAENGVLTYEQFEAAAKDAGAKFADLATGGYVSKSKYDADLKAVNTQVETLNGQINVLNGTITTRDGDLANLKTQLEEAGQSKAKLESLGEAMTALQGKYDADTKAYQDKLKRQSYEFAVKEFANTKKFSSQAAKRDFTQAMLGRELQMEGDKLIGGDDFASIYFAENEDALYVEPAPVVTPEPEPVREPEPAPQPIPTFVASALGVSEPTDTGFQFNFTGVRPH